MAPVPFLMPALVTPFDGDGEVDLEAHRRNLKKLWKAGIRGFLIGGSTGEGPYLDPGDRAALLQAAREQLSKKAYLLCGVAAETTRQAQRMLEEATHGANAALVITPTTLVRNRVANLERFYESLAEASPLPLLLYSVPSVTAYELPEESVSRLAEHPNIIGIKDSGGHPVRLQRIVASVPSDFLVFTGSTQAITLAMAAGAYGAITASTNYLPKKILELVATAKENPIKARELQLLVSTVVAGVERFGIPGVKAAASLAGFSPGLPRSPLADLEDSDRESVKELVTTT